MAKTKKVSNKRVTTKKITRRRRKGAAPDIKQGDVIDLDQFYRAVNRVQISRESFTFLINSHDRALYDNILKDLELPYTCKLSGVRFTEYKVSPGAERPLESDTADVEEFPDEIAEDGQVFFS